MLINRVTCLLLHYFFLSISLADLQPSLFALSDEKCAQLGVENSLAEEKALRQAAEQSLQQSKDSNATLALELENTQTSLAATRDKLDSKLKALDLQVFRADEDMLRLKNAESWLKAADEDLKNQMQLLESAQKTSSKRESFFNMMISSTVAHAVVLFKINLPGLNLELLRQDVTVNDVEHEILVSSAFDAAQDFVSSYDFASLVV
jgi:chromosome segregation ATPase